MSFMTRTVLVLLAVAGVRLTQEPLQNIVSGCADENTDCYLVDDGAIVVYSGSGDDQVYRTANSVCAKVGRMASEEVVVQFLKHKCLPILLYALAVCNLDKSILQTNSTVLSNLVCS